MKFNQSFFAEFAGVIFDIAAQSFQTVAAASSVLLLLAAACYVVMKKLRAPNKTAHALDADHAARAEIAVADAQGGEMRLFAEGDAIQQEQIPSILPPLRLIFYRSEIFPIAHARKTSARAAAQEHQTPAAQIAVSRNISWSVSGSLLDIAAENGQKIIPFGAAVWDCADRLFGTLADRQVIATIAGLSRPLTYSLSVANGQVTEKIIHGNTPQQELGEMHEKTFHIDIISAGASPPEDFAPPQSAQREEISIRDFLAGISVLPLSQVKLRRGVPVAVAVSSVAVAACAVAGLHAANFAVSGEISALHAERTALGEETDAVNGEIRSVWQQSIPAFVEDRRENMLPFFQRADAAGQISPVNLLSWNKKDAMRIEFNLPLANGNRILNQIRGSVADNLQGCAITETYDLERNYEIKFSLSCSN